MTNIRSSWLELLDNWWFEKDFGLKLSCKVHILYGGKMHEQT